MFEFGSGASSVWLARRAGTVTTVEHDRDWAASVERALAPYPNAHLVVAGFDPKGPAAEQPYVQAIAADSDHAPYDLIIVDGRRRNDCLTAAIPHLKPDGMILFDDSGRDRYRSAIEGCGLVERHDHGLSYCVPYPDHTSLLARSAELWA